MVYGYVPKAWTGLTNIFSKLGSWFGERWADVTNALSKVASWFGDIFGKALTLLKMPLALSETSLKAFGILSKVSSLMLVRWSVRQ